MNEYMAICFFINDLLFSTFTEIKWRKDLTYKFINQIFKSYKDTSITLIVFHFTDYHSKDYYTKTSISL